MGYTPKFILFVLHFKFMHFCNIEKKYKENKRNFEEKVP